MNEVIFRDVRDKLSLWLEAAAKGLEPGRFRYGLKNNLAPVSGDAGAFTTCFAVKTAIQTGIWQEWPEARRGGALNFIRSRQETDGFFTDPYLQQVLTPWKGYAAALLGRRRWPESAGEIRRRNRLADTRQNTAVLLAAGSRPEYPLPCELKTPADVDAYFRQIDWRNPWSECSHLSHQIFFRTVNFRCFNLDDGYKSVVDRVLERLAEKRHAENGCWYEGDIPDWSKINGAMKVFSMLAWLDRPLPDCGKLLEFALAQPSCGDGCGFLNRLYVVYNARKGAGGNEMTPECRQLAEHACETALEFLRPDGGFSFELSGAEKTFYNRPVTLGGMVGDMHGAVMLTWALAICIEILGIETRPQWRVLLP